MSDQLPRSLSGMDSESNVIQNLKKTLQRNLFDEKGEKRKNFDGTCILTNITFILHFGLLPLQYLEFCYYMTADDKNGVTLYEKTAASKTNKYNATLEMVRSSRANALVTQLHFG